MKKIFIIMILIILMAAISSAIPISKIPIDTNQKLKSYANVNLKETIKYNDFQILKIEKFDGYVIIYFVSDGKKQRWFKTTKSFDRLIK